MIQITMKNGDKYDHVEETETHYFYVGSDGFNKYIKKYLVDKVEIIEPEKQKQKKSLILNLFVLIMIVLLFVGEL
jgi:hypothetical protein